MNAALKIAVVVAGLPAVFGTAVAVGDQVDARELLGESRSVDVDGFTVTLEGQGAVAGDVPAVPGLPARRGRTYGCVHRDRGGLA